MAAAISVSPRPNPAVGCLIVREGAIVARGATRPSGRPHAETEALREAGEAARGATLYVTLEPCSHFGQTPPCADAIVRAGVARVVSALEDPDARVAGRGHAKLVEAGIGLLTGVCVTPARRLARGHILRVVEGRPMVTLKLAQTADGFAAGGRYDPRLMITGVAATGRVQILRATHDAIMVGVGTAHADDPLLTIRAPGLEGRRPLRVVLDTHLSLSPRSRIAATAADRPTLVIAGEDASKEREAALLAAGVSVARVATARDGRIDLQAALRHLGSIGITRVLSEGGPTVASALIARGLADETILFTSPKPLVSQGAPALDPAARAALHDAARFRLIDSGFAGVDAFANYEKVA